MNANTHTFEGTSEYRVVPMHPAVLSAVPALGHAFAKGFAAQKDPERENFYSVEIEGISYYFHVYRKQRTAYLLSAELKDLGFAPAKEPPVGAGIHSC